MIFKITFCSSLDPSSFSALSLPFYLLILFCHYPHNLLVWGYQTVHGYIYKHNLSPLGSIHHGFVENFRTVQTKGIPLKVSVNLYHVNGSLLPSGATNLRRNASMLRFLSKGRKSYCSSRSIQRSTASSTYRKPAIHFSFCCCRRVGEIDMVLSACYSFRGKC